MNFIMHCMIENYYHEHKDQFKNNSDRKYSLINYLNKDWQEKDGGALMVYQDDKIKAFTY